VAGSVAGVVGDVFSDGGAVGGAALLLGVLPEGVGVVVLAAASWLRACLLGVLLGLLALAPLHDWE
jgi:hypothetical protein